MTEWYCHFDPKEFTDVRQAQEALLQPEQKQETALIQTSVVDWTEQEKVIPFPATAG
jgi:hypothetical protein